MNLLALECLSEGFSITYCKGDKIHTLRNTSQSSTNNIIDHITDFIETHNISLPEIEYFLTISGYGSYTGIRIAISTLLGLSFSTNTKILHLSSLEYLSALEQSDYLLHTKGQSVISHKQKEVNITEILNSIKNPTILYTNKNKLFEDYVLRNKQIKIKQLPYCSEHLISIYKMNRIKFKELDNSIYG